jgi:hypothetical protein
MTQRRFLLDGMHPFVQLILLSSFVLISSVTFTLLAMYLVRPLFGVTALDTLTQAAITNPASLSANRNEVNALKFVQLMASLGTFLFPPLLFARIKFPGGDFLRMKVSTPMIFALLGVLVLFASAPLIDWIYRLNQSMELPAAMAELEKNIRESEEAAKKFTELFLQAPGLTDLLFNLLVIAIVPAIGEELMFRGAVQQVLKEWTKNIHVAIWVSAAIFSFVHFQFYGFVPRLMLGAVLGYVFAWSGSIWVPMIAHAVYNGTQVTLAYLYEHKYVQFDVTADTPLPVSITVAASIVGVVLLYTFRNLVNRRRFIY